MKAKRITKLTNTIQENNQIDKTISKQHIDITKVISSKTESQSLKSKHITISSTEVFYIG
jgi:RNase P subunit RPR2